MNEFEKIICRILKELEYESVGEISIGQGISACLYKKEELNETQYYIVSTSKEEALIQKDFNDLQNEIYNNIKNLLEDPLEVDKNTSWLIGIEKEPGKEVEYSNLLKMEENPYYFKKTACPFSMAEVNGLLQELSDKNSYLDYMQQEITKVTRFTDFWEDKEEVYGFIARLFIKLPIIKVPIKKGDKLPNLSSDIGQELSILGLDKLYQLLKEEIIDEKKITDKKEITDEVVEHLYNKYSGDKKNGK